MAWMRRSRHHRVRGFTLIEQVTVVAIIAVLAGIASPPLASLLRRARLQSAQMGFMEGLGYARSEAVVRQVRVVFCPSRDQRHCSDESHWEGGWLVGVDRNYDNQPDNQPLRVGAGHKQLLIQSSAARRHVAFLPDGTAGGSNLTLLFCSPGNERKPLGVVVSNAGRIRGMRPNAEQAAACGES